ncbi:protein rep [Carnobacteriaceae bacterium zg-ZUI78]|nr:protein rep [Carnobacteriaceae bacterium zg-ZUI78]
MQDKNSENKIFIETTKNGKDKKWRERKIQNIELATRLNVLHYRSSERAFSCSEVLTFRKDDEHYQLYQTWFCKNKLCPICNWRRSMKYSYQAMQIVTEAMRKEPKGRFLFLTLTVKNICAEDLNHQLSELTKSFKRLFERKKVTKNLIGFLRATEVTRNSETELYHPHLHVLMFVKSSYFKGNGENYISQDEWQAMWKQSAKLTYDPIVDIRCVKPNEKKGIDDMQAAVLETAKYPVKPINEMGKTEKEKLQITDDLYRGLYRKRQIAFGGLFKQIKKELACDDIESGDLVNVENEKNISEDVELLIARWNWNMQNYFIEN